MKNIFFFLLLISGLCKAQTTHVINPSGYSGSPAAYSGNVVYLSKAGILSDAVLDTGTSTFGSDQTAAIQVILNTATLSNPLTVFVDVRASHKGLKVKSNTTINILQGFGLVLRDSSNKPALSNYNWVPFNNSIVDSNITINGGIWNCNGWRNGVGKQNHSDSTSGMTVGFLFFGVKNLTLTNFELRNTRTWGMALLTVENVLMDRIFINNYSGKINQDGFDALGYCKNLTVTNSQFTAADDRLSFLPNATGGTIGTENHYPYTGVNGDQTNINIHHIYFRGNGKGLAFYLQGGNEIRDVFVSDISGTAKSSWFNMANNLSGYTITGGSKIAHNISVENINVEVTGYIGYGNANFPVVNIQCSVDNLSFKNISRSTYDHDACSFTFKTEVNSPAVTIDNLTIDGFYTSNTNPGNYPAPANIVLNNVTINRITLSNVYSLLGTISFERQLMNITSTSTVHKLFLQNINFNPSKTMLLIAGTVDQLMMNNVVHTGNTITDPTISVTGTLTKATVTGYIGNLLSSGTIGTLVTAATTQ